MLHDKSLYRIPVCRRLFNGGHIPNTGQSHVQGSGNRCSGEGQHIHTFGNLLQPLLVGNAKALLFINNEKPQIFELYTLLQQLVGTDNQIHLTGTQILQGAVLLCRGAETAEHIDIDRESPESGHRCLVVLLGKDGGGYKDCRLLAVHNALHDGPESHLSFAEAHIAAEQTIHGGGRFHI